MIDFGLTEEQVEDSYKYYEIKKKRIDETLEKAIKTHGETLRSLDD